MGTLDLGDGLVLEPWVFEDAPDFFTLVESNRAHLGEFLAWVDRIISIDDAYRQMERFENDNEAGKALRFAVRQNNQLVGAVNIVRLEPGVAELGTWLAQVAVGRGIARRASRAAIDHARNALALERLVFHLRSGNEASRAYIKGLGFRFEAREPGAEKHRGEYYDLDRYSLPLVSTD